MDRIIVWIPRNKNKGWIVLYVQLYGKLYGLVVYFIYEAARFWMGY